MPLDTLHATGFYTSAGLSVLGGLAVAFLDNRARRAAALALAGVGVSGIYLSLSAGFAAVMALVTFAAAAALLARPDYRAVLQVDRNRLRQAGGVACALLFAALAYAAFKGTFVHGTFYGGAFDSAAVGRLLLGHDALATEAVAAIAAIVLVGATFVWRSAGKGR